MAKKKHVSDSEEEQQESENEEESPVREKIKISKKRKERLKAKIIEWVNEDDIINEINAQLKEHREIKKKKEEIIINMITKLGMEGKKIDVHDGENLRGRVYKHKHITKAPLKEGDIKSALMETLRDERKVEQLLKKINNKRPISERYYLKRTDRKSVV